MSVPKFRKGDVVTRDGSKTMMSIVGPSNAITSAPCWECEFFNKDMKKVRRAFVESVLKPVKPSVGGHAA